MPEPTREGFESWVAARRPALLRTAYLLTGDLHEAEDLVQNTLIRIVGHWRKIADAPDPYVRRALVNGNISRWRRRRRDLLTDAVPDAVVAGGEEHALARAEVATALRELSPRQRAVVVLRYYEDMTEAQTAQVLGLGLGTVKSYAREGLATLRASLPRPESAVRPRPSPSR